MYSVVDSLMSPHFNPRLYQQSFAQVREVRVGRGWYNEWSHEAEMRGAVDAVVGKAVQNWKASGCKGSAIKPHVITNLATLSLSLKQKQGYKLSKVEKVVLKAAENKGIEALCEHQWKQFTRGWVPGLVGEERS